MYFVSARDGERIRGLIDNYFIVLGYANHDIWKIREILLSYRCTEIMLPDIPKLFKKATQDLPTFYDFGIVAHKLSHLNGEIVKPACVSFIARHDLPGNHTLKFIDELKKAAEEVIAINKAAGLDEQFH